MDRNEFPKAHEMPRSAEEYYQAMVTEAGSAKEVIGLTCYFYPEVSKDTVDCIFRDRLEIQFCYLRSPEPPRAWSAWRARAVARLLSKSQ